MESGTWDAVKPTEKKERRRGWFGGFWVRFFHWICEQRWQRLPRFGEAFQDWEGGGRLKRVQCQGRTTECRMGTGTAAEDRTNRMAAATGATGAAECMTTQIGQWSPSAAAG